MLTAEIAHQLKKKRVKEKAVLQGFERWRKGRREPGRRR
jgi:Ni/Co efflux regulator RcnB